MQVQICHRFRPLGWRKLDKFSMLRPCVIHDVHFQWLFQSVLYKSLHQFKTIFATMCFGGTFDASIGSEDLWSQRRTCSCMYNMYSVLKLSCFVYNAYNSKVGLLLNSICTRCLVHYVLHLLVVCSLNNSCFSTLHALGHGFEGGLPWRIPAPCTVHVAPWTVHLAPWAVHRAPTGLSPITDNQGVSHGKYEPLLLSSNVLSSPRLMLDLLLKYQFVPIAPYKYWDRPTIDLNACRASTGKAHIQGGPKKSDE